MEPVVDLLAQNYFGDTRSGSLIGPAGTLLFALLVVATVFLLRDMRKRLRQIDERFPATPPPGVPAPGTVARSTSRRDRQRGRTGQATSSPERADT